MLIMPEPLIMQELVSGRSWTSKVFNTVITLDTYQFVVGEKMARNGHKMAIYES